MFYYLDRSGPILRPYPTTAFDNSLELAPIIDSFVTTTIEIGLIDEPVPSVGGRRHLHLSSEDKTIRRHTRHDMSASVCCPGSLALAVQTAKDLHDMSQQF